MPEVILTRRELFNAAHRLFRSDLNDEENYKIYGKCSNPNWHGHNYTLWISVKGEIDPVTGYIVNLKEIGRVVKEQIIEKLDHKNLNVEVDFLNGILPSTENLVVQIWKTIEPFICELGVTLHCIKIQETENNSAEFYGFK